MPEGNIDDGGKEKTYAWLDEVFPYEVHSQDAEAAEELVVRRLLEISKAAKEWSKNPNWNPGNVMLDLRVNPDSDSWHFGGVISTLVTRETQQPGAIRKHDDHDWDLGDLITEVMETARIPDRVASETLMRMQASDRRNYLKGKAASALRTLTMDMDTSFPSLELERRRDAVRVAYEHLMKGIVYPAFDPEAIAGRAAVDPTDKAGVRVQREAAPAPHPDYVI